METAITKQPVWEDLFRTNSSAASLVIWRVLRKNGEPLLALPASGKAAAASLALYPAQTAKARCLRKVLRTGLALNLPLALERVTIPIDSTAPFARFLAEQAGTKKIPQLGIFAGNPRTVGRRFVLLLFGEHNAPARVVKAGIGEPAQQLIQREETFLASVPASVPGVPKLLGTFRGKNLSAFSMEFFDGESPASGDTETVATLVNSWVDDKTAVAIGETTPWRELEAVLSSSSMRARLEKLRGISARRVLWHGDLAPWNMKRGRSGKCVVLDWERGQLAGVPGWDWFHFVIQTGALVKKLSAGELRIELESLLRSEKFLAYARRCGIAGFERELALAYLLYCLEIIKPSEGGAEIRALLNLLTHSWTSDSKS